MTAHVHNTLRRITPQLIILAAVLMLNFMVFPDFFRIEFQNGRLFGNLIDVLNRGAPTALLCIGMTLVIATRGIDLSVGASWRLPVRLPLPLPWMDMAGTSPLPVRLPSVRSAACGTACWLLSCAFSRSSQRLC